MAAMAAMRLALGRGVRSGLAGTLLALAAAAPAQPSAAAPAQPPVPPENETITVTGQRDRAEAIRAFIRRVTVESGGQVAAFHEPLCPASYGLPASHNAVVAALIRAAAARARLPLARPPCTPNVVVLVVEDGGDLIARLRRARPGLFAALDGPELRALAAADGPARAWQIVEPRGADGRPMTRVSFLRLGDRPPIYIGETRLLTGVRPSLTTRATRQDLILSLIVFDLAGIEGLSLRQLADYAAMRTLARTEAAAGPAPGRSILTLFDDRSAGQAPADGLTRWDAAYLTALYAAGDNLAAAQQRSAMARMVGAALAGGAPER